ncbi:MAG: hypothetical protein ABR556_03195 [Pyrinomonadaceae bacterium]
MKKLAATLFITTLVAINVLGQGAPPTLRIVTETPGLPSELFYGDIKVKPLRLRPGTNTPITIADYDFFIQQQYIDFLRRFPDPGLDGVFGTADDSLKYYLDLINNYLNTPPCTPTNTECIKVIRGIESANFFRSPEFQRKGNYVLYLYMGSLGQRPVTPAELGDSTKIDRPHYPEFLRDLQSISTPNDDPVLTNAKKDALAVAWLQRPEIQAKYPDSPTMSNAQFVQALFNTAGVTVSNQNWVSELNGGKSRAKVLREFAESPEIDAKYYQQAYVTMEYFGYLRRDPEDCHGSPDPSQCGFIFHNSRFNDPRINPAHIQNIMVQGFIESPEYINRF